MGYETTLIFVKNYKDKFVGYCSVEATLELGKVAYGEIAELIDEIKARSLNKLKPVIESWDRQQDLVWGSDGEHTDEFEELSGKEQIKALKSLEGLETELESKLPFVFHSDLNKEQFDDQYGDLLMIAELAELKTALIKEQARLIAEKEQENGYYKFDIALKLIDAIRADDSSKYIKVILWGH